MKGAASAAVIPDDKLEVEEGEKADDTPIGRSASKSSMNSDRARALSEARKNPPPEYDPEIAIELERLQPSNFKKSFFEQMEVLNYDRYIDSERYVYPEFIDPPQ